jgi:hypothetical protein
MSNAEVDRLDTLLTRRNDVKASGNEHDLRLWDKQYGKEVIALQRREAEASAELLRVTSELRNAQYRRRVSRLRRVLAYSLSSMQGYATQSYEACDIPTRAEIDRLVSVIARVFNGEK